MLLIISLSLKAGAAIFNQEMYCVYKREMFERKTVITVGKIASSHLGSLMRFRLLISKRQETRIEFTK